MLTVFSKTDCPYCVMLKGYLEDKNIPFRETYIDQDHEAREFMLSLGLRTVPQIFMDGKIFAKGGWDQISKMSADDILTHMEIMDTRSLGTL